MIVNRDSRIVRQDQSQLTTRIANRESWFKVHSVQESRIVNRESFASRRIANRQLQSLN